MNSVRFVHRRHVVQSFVETVPGGWGREQLYVRDIRELPLEIPANSRRELAVRFQVGEHLRGQKEFTSSLVYYLEGGQQFGVRGVVVGRVIVN